MNRRQSVSTFLLALFLVLAGPATAQTLPARIDARIDRSDLRHAIWGVHVEDESGAVIYSRNGDTLLIPASVRKLFSAATVASCRGLDWRYETDLWIDGEIEDGVLHGNVIVHGSGDPSLGSRYAEPQTTAIFDGWVASMKGAGIRMINGGVVADASEFDDAYYPGSWKYDNIGESYAPPIDALAFNENGVGIFLESSNCRRFWVATDPWFVPVVTDTNCTGRYLTMRTVEENVLAVGGNPGRSTPGEIYTDLKSITDPSLYVAQALEAKLEEAGIRTMAAPRVTKQPLATGSHAGVIASPPLYTLLGTMLESSSNLFAEMLFKSVSATRPASWEGAEEVERYFLTRVVGLDPDSFDFEDGSGLAVENYVSTRATVGLLRWMTDPDRRAYWEEILASPGESGTLRRRLKPFEGRLWGKTGTLDGVRALAGYFVRRDGQLRYFAIIVNHHSAPAWKAGEVIDQIVWEIDQAQ